MGDLYGVCQVADHAYRGVGIEHLQQSALLQCFSIIQVWGQTLKAARLKPYVISDLLASDKSSNAQIEEAHCRGGTRVLPLPSDAR